MVENKGIILTTFNKILLSYPIIITLNKDNTLKELKSLIIQKLSKNLKAENNNSIIILFPHFDENWIKYKISNKICPICKEKYNKTTTKYCSLFKFFDSNSKISTLMNKAFANEQRPLILFAFSTSYDLQSQIYKGMKLFTSNTKNEKKTKDNLTIYDSLELFHKEEILDGENKWFCGKCKNHEKAIKKLEIYKTPYYLIIQLKRFKQRGSLMSTVMGNKNETMIDYKEILNLNDFVVGPDKEKSIYYLYGVVIHKKLLNGGHYYSYCKNQGEWLTYNDVNVNYCKNPINKDAYLLFYKRKTYN